MAKVTGNYEVLYIINPNLGEEETAALVAKFKDLAESRGTVTEVAYLINDLDEGYYVLMTFTADAAFPAELDRLMRINTGIMRSIIVSKDV